MRALYGFIILLCSSGTWSQTNGVSFFGHLNQPHGSGYSACWGYTHPNGREYVITGAYTGTSIIDITDSANIAEVAFISGPSSSWREMRTYKNRAYVVTEGGGGVQIINLANLPGGANLIRSFNYSQGSNNISSSHTIEIFDGYMYLNGCANWPPAGVLIFSLANPDTPTYVGQYQPPGTGNQRYVHDSYVRNDTLFAASIYSGGGINIANIANKSAPVHITKISYSGSGTHNVWTTKDGRYVLSTDEIGSTAKNLKFWDLSTLPTPPPNPATTYTFNPSDIVHNVTVRGNYAYVAWYTAGLVVVDIANPLNPQTAGSYDTYPGTSGGYNGAWAVYPYFPSGKIAISDMQTGTWVFRFNGLAPRRPLQLIEPVHNDTMIGRRTVTFRWSSVANQNDDPHYYRLRIVGGAMDTSIRVNDTSFTEMTSLLGLQPNTIYQWYVLAMDEANAIPSADTFQFAFDPTVNGAKDDVQPLSYTLEQNFPNPFNPSTTIRFTLQAPGFTSLKIYDLLGQEVAALVNEAKQAGQYEIRWNASGLSSGVYFYRLQSGTYVETRKLVLTR